MIAAALLLASALERPEILAVRCEPSGSGRALVKVLAAAELQGVTTERHGDDYVVAIPATVAEGLALPRPSLPLETLSFEAGASDARLRLAASPGTRVEARAEGSLLTIVLEAGDQPASRDVEKLYPLLFPGHLEPPIAAPQPTASAEDRPRKALSFRPTLVLRYVDAESTFLDTPQPVEARYLEAQPGLTVTASPGGFEGRLTLRYEPRLRRNDSLPLLSQPSHFVSVNLETPIGSSLWLTAGDDWTRGALEANVLDPGREYFYNLGRFRRNQESVRLRTETPGRLDWEIGASSATESVAPGTGYFDNKREQLNLAARYELGPTLKAALRYEFERVPPPAARPIVESRAHSLLAVLEGDVSTTLKANLSAGLRDEKHPQAVAGADAFRGFVFGLSLRREFLSGASFTLSGARSSQLSAFEANAFYVTTGVQAHLVTPLRYGAMLSLGASHQWNDYRLNAAGLSEPRRDRLFGWTAGLARSITSWSFLRADYTWDRRRSNVPRLSTRTHAFVAQLGLGGGVATGR